MKNTIMSSKNLCKSFASNGTQNHVLDNINLTIYEGDFTVIMGASGSGKSTLLYCLSGMDSVTSGDVFYKEKSITNLKEKEMASLRSHEFGFVFQQMHLVSNLTLFENVVVPGYLNENMSSREVEERALQLLKTVNVEKAKDRLPFQVSGGEAQRAAIARAIIAKPGMVFADEPTGALNKKNSNDVLNLLTQINKEGQSIIMVTHDARAAIRADRLIYLEDGTIRGDMELSKYDEKDIKSREQQVNAWLESLEW